MKFLQKFLNFNFVFVVITKMYCGHFAKPIQKVNKSGVELITVCVYNKTTHKTCVVKTIPEKQTIFNGLLMLKE